MKSIFLLAGLISLSIPCIGQDAKEILQKAFDKCQTIQNGYFEMMDYEKDSDRKDTNASFYTCYFKKLPEDKLYPSAFHYQHFIKGKYAGEAIYTGNEYAYFSAEDSTGVVMPKSKWSKIILSDGVEVLYSPLTGRQSDPIVHGSALKNSNYVFTLIGEESIDHQECYHIRVNSLPEKNNPKDDIHLLRYEFNFWIFKNDFLPVQYSESIDYLMNQDTLYQYEKFTLTKTELNNLQDVSGLILSSVPSFYKIKEYEPYKSPPLLPHNSLAPDWSLVSIQDEEMSLHELSDKLILIDFFFKGCPPCREAFPVLESLQNQFRDQGLKVVGIDPFDTKEDDMVSFLSKYGVTYTVLLGGESVAKKYNVSAYPTIYLIDMDRKILYSKVGYSKGTESSLESVIKKNLN